MRAEGQAWASKPNCPAGETEERSGLESLPRGSEETRRLWVLGDPEGRSRAPFSRPGGSEVSSHFSGSPETESPHRAPVPDPPASRVKLGSSWVLGEPGLPLAT